MKKKNLIISLTAVLFSIHLAISQNDSPKNQVIRLNSINFLIGVNHNQSVNITTNNYKKMAPQDSLESLDMSSYSRSTLGLNLNLTYGAYIGFNCLNKKTQQYNKQCEHRIGIRFYSNKLLPLYYDKSKKYTVDTLNYKNKDYYNVKIDSSIYFYYYVKRNNVMLDFGTIYQSNLEHLLTYYAGYNVGVGYGFGTIVHAEYSRTTTLINRSNLNEFIGGPYKIENAKINNSFLGSINFICGLNFRLAKTRKFWNKVVLNLELRAGFATETIQAYGNYTRANFGSNFGVKILL